MHFILRAAVEKGWRKREPWEQGMLGTGGSLQIFVSSKWLRENSQLFLTFTRRYILCLKDRPNIRAVGNTLDARVESQGGERQALS